MPVVKELTGGYFNRFHVGTALSNGDWVIAERAPEPGGPRGEISVLSRDLSPAKPPAKTPLKFHVNLGRGIAWERTIGRNKQDHVAVASGQTFYVFTNLAGESPSDARITKTFTGWTISAIAALSDSRWVVAMNDNKNVGRLVTLKRANDTLAEVSRLSELDKVTAIAVQSDDDILIGTETGAVLRFDVDLKIKHASAKGLRPIAHMAVMTR